MPDAAPHRLEPIRRDRTGVFRGYRRRRRVVRARRRSGHRVRRTGTGLARKGVRARERHRLMPAGAARESRGRIRAGGSGPHGHARGRLGHEDGGFLERGLSGTLRGGTGQRCAPGHRVLPGVRAGRPARFCRWPPADSVPRAGAPGRKLSGSAPPDVIRDISHWPRAVREGWRGAVGVWRRDAPRRP